MPRQVGDTFSAIAYIDSAWSVVGVPFIDTSLMQLLPQDEELERQFIELLDVYPADAPLSYNKAWEWLGKPSGQRTDRNPEYRAFKKVFDGLRSLRQSPPDNSEQAEQDG